MWRISHARQSRESVRLGWSIGGLTKPARQLRHLDMQFAPHRFTLKKLSLFTFSVIWSLLGITACGSVRFYQTSPMADQTRQQIVKLKATLREASDDPAYYDTVISRDGRLYHPTLSTPYWVIPTLGFPKSVTTQRSNNNVTICIYQTRLYMAFRTGPHHFPSRKTSLFVISSADLVNWQKELHIQEGKDIREPHLIVLGDTLHLYYFEAGTSPWAFKPTSVHHYVKVDTIWQRRGTCLSRGEVPWDLKKRFGRLFLTSYRGARYQLWGDSKVEVCFRASKDGYVFEPVGDTAGVYVGGASECAFEFDADSTLWIVTRLDDGDTSGFGSHVGWAAPSTWHRWHLSPPDPHCYMSPKLLRHRDQIYLIARRQLGSKPFGWANRKLPLWSQRLLNWVSFSLTSKTTSLYRLNKTEKRIEWITDLPGNGDTAFPSIQRLDEDTFLIANYSSPLGRLRSWLRGQLGRTGIYLILLTFRPSLE